MRVLIDFIGTEYFGKKIDVLDLIIFGNSMVKVL